LSEEEGRSLLGRFLFSGDDVFKNIGLLSGGEKSRVALAKLILEEPNVLVLDEPTNHLDIASRDALQNVLDGFSGTLLFVSHDRYLIDALAQHLWVLRDAQLFRYDCNYSDMVSGRSRSLEHETPKPVHGGSHISPEQHLGKLHEEVESLASRLSEVAGTTSVAQMAELIQRYEELQTKLEETQRSWLRTLRQELHSSSG
jgi:ABC-type multidrug transport system ATPase subunit